MKKTEERFMKKRASFLESMKNVLGIDEIDNCDVQSNNMNSTGLKSLIEKLIGAAFDNQEERHSDDLDWVKREIEKY